ncbi:PSP1-domain-containing protein, partial [Saccharata proteae CBS 121410]
MINPYGSATLSRPTQHLYIVTFKCSRSDVYYIPDNVGLEVKSGDMVIVEGDRGHDLGQVTQVDVSIDEARRHLRDMSEQHFRWLMMFSRHEIRPKMLKRLAQGHEIQVLRDKEGAEAKAKRICQQKAMEHGLTMEILDAEYQFDYHKLTFFYFAEAYINFNSLVTELFKIYKARIWMSAVN